jgi:hypothetical protein
MTYFTSYCHSDKLRKEERKKGRKKQRKKKGRKERYYNAGK